MTTPISPIPNNPIGESHEWRDWFFKLYSYTTTAGSQAFNGLSFLGSNITSIVTRNHNDLTLIQGGDSLNRYHLTSAQQASVASLPTFGTMATQNASSVAITGGTVTATVGLTNTTGTTVGATGTASALPALPVGYVAITIGGVAYKMPYYNV